MSIIRKTMHVLGQLPARAMWGFLGGAGLGFGIALTYNGITTFLFFSILAAGSIAGLIFGCTMNGLLEEGQPETDAHTSGEVPLANDFLSDSTLTDHLQLREQGKTVEASRSSVKVLTVKPLPPTVLPGRASAPLSPESMRIAR